MRTRAATGVALAVAAIVLAVFYGLSAVAPLKTVTVETAQVMSAHVRAADYDAFWLWAGVTPQPVLAKARSLYILHGQVDFAPDDPTASGTLIAQGGATPRLHQGAVWMVYRVHTLNWRPQTYVQVLGELTRWRDSGVPVVGVQIDFDARTRHLDQYQAFLRDLRRRLPADCKLSITGLLDWSSQGDPGVLNGLNGVVDEIVLQTYQGRHTIAGYTAYLASLGRLRIPFRIGLVEDGEWSAPTALAFNPYFRGYVVFLLNARPGPST